MRAISLEVRLLAVRNFLEHTNWKLTCWTFNISRTSLHRFVMQHKKGCSLEPIQKRQPPRFTIQHRKYITKIATSKRYMTVAAIIKSFHRKFVITISSRTVRRILKDSSIVYRVLHVRTKPRRWRRKFHKNIKGIPCERLLSVDEMGFGHGHIHPRKFWCCKNSRQNWACRRETKFGHASKTVTCVVSCNEVVHYEHSYVPMNTRAFAHFLRIALVGYCGYTIILDNVSFHKSSLVQSVLKELGVMPVFIDPYSPEQNPIEEVFANVKAFVMRKSPSSLATFSKHLRSAMSRQTKRVLTCYFKRALVSGRDGTKVTEETR